MDCLSFKTSSLFIWLAFFFLSSFSLKRKLTNKLVTTVSVWWFFPTWAPILPLKKYFMVIYEYRFACNITPSKSLKVRWTWNVAFMCETVISLLLLISIFIFFQVIFMTVLFNHYIYCSLKDYFYPLFYNEETGDQKAWCELSQVDHC